MTLITPTTQLKLINDLTNLGTASSPDLMLIQKDLKSFKLTYGDLVTGLPDNTTLEVNADKLSLKNLGVSTGKIANNAVDFSKIRTINNLSLLGNVSGNTGNVQQVGLQTSLTNSDTNVPTSGAIVDYVATQSNPMAILREQYNDGLHVDGNTSITNGPGANYPDQGTESLTVFNGDSVSFTFFRRRINNIFYNKNSIVTELEETGRFKLEQGLYNITGQIEQNDYRRAVVRLMEDNAPHTYSSIYHPGDDRDGPPVSFNFIFNSDGTEWFDIQIGVLEFNNNSDFGIPKPGSVGIEIYTMINIIKL